MFEVLMFTGIICIVNSTLRMMQIFSTYEIVPKKEKEAPLLIAERSVVPVTMDIKIKHKDNFELERKYAELTIKNNILQERLRQREEEDKVINEQVKNTFKKDGKYSKLAEEILHDGK